MRSVHAHLDSNIARHHDGSMRTTVTLDPDVVALLQEEMAQRRLPFKQVLNQAVRRGLCASGTDTGSPVRTRPHDFGFIPGVDRDRLNQLVDELETEEFVKRYRGDR